MKLGTKREKKLFSRTGKGKKSSAAVKKEKKPSFLFSRKMKLLALFVVLALAAAVLTGFVDVREVIGEKFHEGKETADVSGEEIKAEKADASDLGELENHKASDFIRVLRGDKYLIRYRTTTVYKGESFEAETTYAVSGNNTAMVSGDRATIVREGRVHMLNHADRSMLSWNATGDEGLKRLNTEGLAYLDSRRENGLACEEYTTETTYFRFYFKEDQLVRLVTRINGLDTVMDMIEVSKEVPESLFAVPPDYRNMEL